MQIRDMEARMLEERAEKASLMAEKQALQVSSCWQTCVRFLGQC